MMTTTAPPAPVTSVGLLARLRLTEPVRLYLYGVALVVIVGLNLAGWLVGEWVPYATSSAGVLLAVGAGGEAARASVYSTRSMVRGIMQAKRGIQ